MAEYTAVSSQNVATLFSQTQQLKGLTVFNTERVLELLRLEGLQISAGQDIL